MRSTALLLLLLSAGCALSPPGGSPAEIEGHYRYGFEVEAFRPCGSSEEWWVVRSDELRGGSPRANAARERSTRWSARASARKASTAIWAPTRGRSRSSTCWRCVRRLREPAPARPSDPRPICLYCNRLLRASGRGTLPLGVTGNTPDSDSGKSRFDPWRGNRERPDRTRGPGVFVARSSHFHSRRAGRNHGRGGAGWGSWDATSTRCRLRRATG